MAITDWPENERPREKLLNQGPHSLSDAELLAIFLRVGMKGKTALDLARELLLHFGSLRQLLLSNLEDFCAVPGMGQAKYVQLQACLEMSKRYFLEDLKEADVITSSDACRQFVLRQLADRKRETFACIFLDSQHRILSYDELFYGTLDSASVHPREVVRLTLEKNAAALILCHNHPSGSDQISVADAQLTERLIKALDLIDVRILDHLIVAGNKVVSFAERSLI
jgi:DNA repair protein RadC